MIQLTEDPRQAIEEGRLDHLLEPMLRAIEKRRETLEPWEALEGLVECARTIMVAGRTGESVERKATLAAEMQGRVKRWLEHPSDVVQGAAALVQEQIFRDLLQVPAEKAKEMAHNLGKHLMPKEVTADAGTRQADAGQPAEG